MLCYCGGEIVLRQGSTAKYGKTYNYAFYGCTNFSNDHRIRLELEEYRRLEAQGITELPEPKDKSGMKKVWTRQGHTAYMPRPLQNKQSATRPAYMRLTDEQEAILTHLLRPGIHRIKADADAGVGKTTLLKQLAYRTPGDGTTGIIMAFGKRPSHELLPQLPQNWVAATVHSAGNAAVTAAYGTNPMNPNNYKTRDILTTEYGKANGPDEQHLYGVVTNLVRMVKNLALDDSISNDEILGWAEYYNRDISSAPTSACVMVRRVLSIGRSQAGIRNYGHDFEDMIWLPIVNNLRIPTYRYVAVDEAQDSSKCRMLFAIRSIASSGIIVGDKDQAIFGFTCADTTSMETFAQLIQPVSYPITINWRCPEKILELTRIIHPSIRARPNAPDGYIHEINDEDFFKIVRAGDTVLCRVNADLVRGAYKLIKEGIGAVVLGRDIGKNLKNLIIKLAADGDGGYITTPTLIKRAGEWYMVESNALANKVVRNPDAEQQKLDDDYESILSLFGVDFTKGTVSAVGLPTVESVVRAGGKIDQMFGDEDEYDPKKVVLFSTVHKFKGGQCARIFILRAHELHPHPMAESEWELDQEKNILYVAITRCGDGTTNPDQRLFFVGSMPAMLQDGKHLISDYEGGYRVVH